MRRSRPAPGTAASRLWLLAVAAVAFGLAVTTSLWLFPLYSANRDDSVYVAMARLLEHGHVTLPAAGQEFFRPWASGLVGDRVVLKYTPPWPAVLAVADLVTGTPRVALGLTAAATATLMAVFAGHVLRDRTAGLVAGALLALSPLFVVQSATFLPYVFQLMLGLGFATLLLTGVRQRSTARVVSAGAVAGLAAFARPYDAVLFVLPFLVLGLLGARRRRSEEGWSAARLLARLVAGGVPVLAISLLYNTLVVGGPLRLPFTVTGPQDGFGFGRRGVFPASTLSFTPGEAVAGLLANLRWTPSWVFGGIVLVALAVAGLVRTRGPERWAVAALAVVYPLGYFAFWALYAVAYGWRGLQTFGPFYLLPVLVPLATFAAASLTELGRRARAAATGAGPAAAGSAGARLARPLLAVAAVAMIALTALAVPDKVTENAGIRDGFRAVQQFVAAQHLQNAVLLLPRRGDLGFISDSPFLENDPSLRQSVLYAEDRGAQDFGLVDRYPGRSLYRLSEDLPPGATTGGRLRMDRLRVEGGAAVTLRVAAPSPGDRPVTVAYAVVGRSTWSRPVDAASSDVSWTVAAPGATSPDPEAVRLPATPAAGTLALGLDLRASDTAGSPGRRWEQRIPYRVVDGGTRVELLLPGQYWSHDDRPGAQWQEAAAGNPMAGLG
jgi:hypothetical protein